MDGELYVRELTGLFYPPAEDLAEAPGTFRRKWIVRVHVCLPRGDALVSVVLRFEAEVRAKIEAAYGVRVDEGIPRVVGVRIDDHHLVLEVICRKSVYAIGDETAVATWGVLRAADREWTIDDLQGIPRRYWLWLQ